MDTVDEMFAQWHRERPDLDVTPVALIGRVNKITQCLNQEMGKTFSAHGLNAASFDVLATLRRSGEPYVLTPNDLIAAMMVTSGTMTNRIDQLVKVDLVERRPNPDDGRGVVVSLTAKGFELIDTMLADHVATQARLMSGLSADESDVLNTLLRKFLLSLQ